MLDPSQQLHELITTALAPINAWAHRKGLLGSVRADHIGYTCATHAEFTEMLARHEREFAWVHSVFLSGRHVAVAKLQASAPSAFGPVHYLEISDQKPDRSQTARFNHLEVVADPMEAAIVRWHAQGVVGAPSKRLHHPTHDIVLAEKDGAAGFEVRIEREPLVRSIMQEMGA